MNIPTSIDALEVPPEDPAQDLGPPLGKGQGHALQALIVVHTAPDINLPRVEGMCYYITIITLI